MPKLRCSLFCVFALLALTSLVRAEEDPRDTERQFRFLLTRGDELRDQQETLTAAQEPRWKVDVKRLEGDYKHFLNDHPNHTRAMVAFGGFLYDQQRHEEAMRWWEKAIAVDPREAYAYNDLANEYGHTGQADKALRYYQKAIDLEPTEPTFRFNWATTCQMFRKESHAVYGWNKEEIFQHALEQFRSARDLSPADFEMSSTYAETFYMMPKPDWSAAYAGWQYCLKQPLDEDQRQFVYAHLARVCARMGHNEEAHQWLAKLAANGRQETVRRAIERNLDGKNSPTNPVPETADKP